jgi:hypothetical protein
MSVVLVFDIERADCRYEVALHGIGIIQNDAHALCDHIKELRERIVGRESKKVGV